MNANNVSLALYRPQPGTKAVDIRRGMLQMPEVMQSLEPVERSVFIASTDRTVEEYAAQELTDELRKALQWIVRDIGYKGMGSSDWSYTIVRVAEILKRYYPNFSIKDFRMAFELSVAGELSDYLPNGDNNHYQQFNVEYVCKILNAYKKYRRGVLKKANDSVPKPEQENNPEIEAFYRNVSRRDTIRAFLEYKYRGVFELSPIGEMLCYDNLSEVGLANPVKVTEQEQREIFHETLFELSQKQMAADIAGLKRDGIKAARIQFPAYRLARRNALKATFDWMIKEEIQITDYIKYER